MNCVFELCCPSFILTTFYHVSSDARGRRVQKGEDACHISPAYISSSFMLSWYVWKNREQKHPPCEPSRTQAQHPWSSCHHPTRSACIASATVVTWSCMKHIPISAQPSWLSWPSCGTQASSDHRNRTAFGRNVSFPGRTKRPAHHVRFWPCSLLIERSGRIPCRLCTG